MNTFFALMAEYGTAQIPVAKCAALFGLSPQKAEENATPQPAAQALDAPVATTDPRITAIEQAILDHHFALDTRQHGGVSAANTLDAICTAMGMPWIQGAEYARRGTEYARRGAIAIKQGGQHVD